MARQTYTGQQGLQAATKFRSVTPDDDNDLPDTPTRGVLVGVAGDVSVIGFGDENPVTLPALVAGVIHPISVKRIRSTGTTATSIVAVY